MKSNTRLFGIYLPFFLLSTIICTTLRTVALIVDFDTVTGYFTNKSIINTSDIILIASILFLFTFNFTDKRDLKLIPRFSDALTYSTSILVIGALIFLIAEMTVSLRRLIDFTIILSKFNIQLCILILCLIFGLLTIISFTATALIEKRRSGTRANFGIAAVMFFALYASNLYFDTALPLNAPNKLADEITYLFLSVFFLYETRLSMGREKWRGYISFGFISALLCANSAIPSIIYYIVGGSLISNSIYENLLTLSLFIFVTVRTLMTGNLVEDRISPKMQLIIDSASERQVELCEFTPEEAVEASDEIENQISLSDISDIDKTEEYKQKEIEEELEKQELINKIEKLSTGEDG